MFEDLLERIALTLGEAEIPYMVIGGQAVLLYGEPRLTRDIDITLGVGLERLDKVVAAARQVGLDPLVEPADFTVKTLVLPCEEPATKIRVDFIFSFSPYERQAMQRTRSVRMGSAEVRFASPEDLIVHKVFAGRPRDMEDVKAVMLKNDDLDLGYIRHWLREFAAATGQPLSEAFESVVAEFGRTTTGTPSAE